MHRPLFFLPLYSRHDRQKPLGSSRQALNNLMARSTAAPHNLRACLKPTSSRQTVKGEQASYPCFGREIRNNKYNGVLDIGW